MECVDCRFCSQAQYCKAKELQGLVVEKPLPKRQELIKVEKSRLKVQTLGFFWVLFVVLK
ncbi:hypothetical protein NC653_015461 [Populus alba x Populus x berolinensis]|uniref:Uncharacterized protein n=1 Tax=Populus alba x Populus x berolinensis TaxID=444605 RepID=A0AAD6QKM0_9ROSI|nr:hypothetical protein NC653_015461 [Populus alba x Populus x berolinensis]